jgi:hypothetical protein
VQEQRQEAQVDVRLVTTFSHSHPGIQYEGSFRGVGALRWSFSKEFRVLQWVFISFILFQGQIRYNGHTGKEGFCGNDQHISQSSSVQHTSQG